ncbi:MAG: hypothetical protein M0R20_02355 [Candidatus Omnitrophica bacterium]|jgi:hypothetical protein|nr:hypothetical protein [Candidatus Omnitrophota bacterium]
MKQKIMYIVFVLATIALLIFINKKDNNTGQLVLEEKIPRELSGEQQGLSVQRSQPILSSEGKPGITIIKKSKPKEETVSLETKKINTATIRPKKTSASSSSAVSSSAKSTEGTAAKKPVAGVTKVGKRPSAEQTSELNEQGIIMY